ncbi:hypothetical protein H1C71_039420, partial [Ictidomys tridecemlineatus]
SSPVSLEKLLGPGGNSQETWDLIFNKQNHLSFWTPLCLKPSLGLFRHGKPLLKPITTRFRHNWRLSKIRPDAPPSSPLPSLVSLLSVPVGPHLDLLLQEVSLD